MIFIFDIFFEKLWVEIMGKNFLLNILEVKGLKYMFNNLFFINVLDKKKY